jgi:surfeit locus 1 family protein
VLVLVIVGLFALAGVWQLHRLSERRQHNAFVTSRRTQPVASLDRFLDDPASAEHRRLRAKGRYDTGRELILRGRPNNERPGNHVLTPLVMKGGRTVIVDRGWVPPQLESPRAAEALPPTAHVEVTGIALPSEGSGPFASGRGPIAGHEVSRIDVARIGRALPYRTFPIYLVLVKQRPPQRGDLPEPISLPKLEEGPHLVYAIQWFLFMPIALVGYGAILRREAQKRAVHPPSTT